MAGRIRLLIHADSGPGVLHQITGAIARHGGDIVSVDILEGRARKRVSTWNWMFRMGWNR